MVKRTYDLVSLGSQRFEDRFPGKRRRLDDDVPQPTPWRCNLTALSSTRNLYFVAYGAEIYVYEPQFPSQKLLGPTLIVPSSPSVPGLPGYLDEVQPNAINNLLVTFLGSEEIVATVRDDGDVDVFLVRHIISALRVRSNATESLSVVADDINPVFKHNVGASAWGLAVHTRARVIAVSSNHHEVTVFRFGLAVANNSDTSINGTYDAYNRVINGDSNIPCVAFCNTDDDLEARWLLTTDINGVCRALDLHCMLPVLSFRLGRKIESIFGNSGYDRINAGWTIMFLDRRSFTAEPDVESAIGLQEGEALPDARENPNIWDLSRTTRTLPDLSNAFFQHRSPRSYHSLPGMSRAAMLLADGVDLEVSEEHDNGERRTSTRSSGLEQEGVEFSSRSESSGDESEDERSSASPQPRNVTEDYIDYDDEGTEDTTPSSAYYGGERICGNVPSFRRNMLFDDGLPCPILHGSVRNLYLLQQNSKSEELPRPPFIGLAAPLKQQIQLDYQGLGVFERLNMSIYLPTLGVVVIATQKGRVLVLALTKLGRSARFPRELNRLGTRTIHAMRVEAILPTASQEKQNLRPFAPLHGIAAGPLQGTENSPNRKKRWRLMLMYQDHTMLSYEIIKKASQEDVVMV